MTDQQMQFVKKVNQQDFNQEVLDFKGVVLVDFYADWCGPCRRLAPELEMVAEELTENKHVKIVKCDTEANPEMISKYDISGIPNVTVFKDGKVLKQIIGLNLRSTYKQAVLEALIG